MLRIYVCNLLLLMIDMFMLDINIHESEKS